MPSCISCWALYLEDLNAAQIYYDNDWHTYEGNIFTLKVDGKTVGSKKLNVVVPDALEVEGGSVTAIFGVPAKIPFVAYYEGNEVAINEADIMYFTVNANFEPIEDAGTFEGFTFTGDKEKGIRKSTVVAILIPNPDIGVIFEINLYREDEAVFDFNFFNFNKIAKFSIYCRIR